MKDRLKELRKQLGLKQRELAEKIGVSTGRVGGWESGVDRPGDARIDKICNMFHVRREWLEHGVGEMYEPEAKPKTKAEILCDAATTLFNELSEEAQKAVLKALGAQSAANGANVQKNAIVSNSTDVHINQ